MFTIESVHVRVDWSFLLAKLILNWDDIKNREDPCRKFYSLFFWQIKALNWDDIKEIERTRVRKVLQAKRSHFSARVLSIYIKCFRFYLPKAQSLFGRNPLYFIRKLIIYFAKRKYLIHGHLLFLNNYFKLTAQANTKYAHSAPASLRTSHQDFVPQPIPFATHYLSK